MAKPSPCEYVAIEVDPSWQGWSDDHEPPLVAIWLKERGSSRPLAVITFGGSLVMLAKGKRLTREIVYEAFDLYDTAAERRRGIPVTEH